MARGIGKSSAVVENGVLYTEDPATTGARVGSPEWFTWLQQGLTFHFNGCTFRAELRRKGLSWYAFKFIDGKTHKVYVGRSSSINLTMLSISARVLTHPIV